MQQEYPEPTSTLVSPAASEKLDKNPDAFEDQCEDHHHHKGCQHSKQRLPLIITPKIGRNDPCPCGSGKKHKKCCLK
jgi:uncharacterized protein YecA (UPF0149 family)